MSGRCASKNAPKCEKHRDFCLPQFEIIGVPDVQVATDELVHEVEKTSGFMSLRHVWLTVTLPLGFCECNAQVQWQHASQDISRP